MTNPMTMLERVADALSTVTTGPNAGDLVISQIFSDELWAIMSDRLARAAIAAMIGPTALMIAAAQTTRADDLDPTDLELVGFYNAMVHAALSEHQTQTRKG